MVRAILSNSVFLLSICMLFVFKHSFIAAQGCVTISVNLNSTHEKHFDLSVIFVKFKKQVTS